MQPCRAYRWYLIWCTRWVSPWSSFLILQKLSFSSLVFYSLTSLDSSFVYKTTSLVIGVSFFIKISNSAVSKSYFNHNHEFMHCNTYTTDQSTACTLTSFLMHSKLVWCNSFLLNFRTTQIIICIRSSCRHQNSWISSNNSYFLNHYGSK